MDSKSITQAKLFIGIDMHKRARKVHGSSYLFAGKTFTMPQITASCAPCPASAPSWLVLFLLS